MARKDGYWSGYYPYRYGTKKTAKHSRILQGPIRKKAIAIIIEELSDWRSSPFEYESDCRQGMRSALCLNGYPWQIADHEAEIIVSEAFKALGAKRPSWDEGQYSHTDSLDYCSWCKGPMQGLNTTRKQRFCSVDCARNALKLRSYETYAFADRFGKSAYRIIARDRSAPRVCKYCATSFKSDRPDAQFCSIRCATHHQKGESLLADIACGWCQIIFKPGNRSNRYCSHSCHSKAMRAEIKEKLKETTLECQCCNATYTPIAERTIYCSARCASVMAKRAYYYRQKEKTAAKSNVIYLTPAVFDSWFRKAA